MFLVNWVLSKVDIHVPLMLTRRWMYLVCVFAVIFGILGPFSVLSYYKLHEALIPAKSPPIPLDFTSSATQSIHVTGENSPTSNYEFDPLVKYRWNIHLNLICGDRLKGKLIPVNYYISSDNLTLYENFFILDCDTRYAHNVNNQLIPYNLRFWMPPITVNFDRSVLINLDKYTSLGSDLAFTTKKLSIQLQQVAGLIVDNDRSWLDFQMEFNGFRYYINKYYTTSFIVGVGSFWSTNTILCLITALYVLDRSFQDTEDQPKIDKIDNHEWVNQSD